MKKFFIFSLLGFIGCTGNTSRQHEILCMDNNEQFVNFHAITAGNVNAFTLKGQYSFLSYKDAYTNKLELIDLREHDCEVY